MTDFMTREDERPWRAAPVAFQPGTVSILSASNHWMCDANPAWAHLIMAQVNAYDPEKEKKVEALVEALEVIRDAARDIQKDGMSEFDLPGFVRLTEQKADAALSAFRKGEGGE